MTPRISPSTDGPEPYTAPMRLQRYLARAGVASRRRSEEIIAEGRVSVDGEVTTEVGRSVTPGLDAVSVDGRAIELPVSFTHVMLHKPVGYVTTVSDTHDRPVVMELVTSQAPGLFPVGRLDLDTSGLLLVTNDGDLAQRLIHPRFHIPKRYVARVRGTPDEEALRLLRAGVRLDDGPTAPAEARVVESRGGEAMVELTLREGRKRQVRRMLKTVGHPVLTLHRITFGPLELGDLPVGQARELAGHEVSVLQQAAPE